MAAAAARMQPGRTARHDLQCLHRRADGGEHRKCVRFGVEGIDILRRARPMPARAIRLRQSAADARRRRELIFRPVAFENLSHFKERDVAGAAIRIASRRRQQPGHQARPHVGQFRGDRIGERKL
jgi:hypothetical protein